MVHMTHYQDGYQKYYFCDLDCLKAYFQTYDLPIYPDYSNSNPCVQCHKKEFDEYITLYWMEGGETFEVSFCCRACLLKFFERQTKPDPFYCPSCNEKLSYDWRIDWEVNRSLVRFGDEEKECHSTDCVIQAVEGWQPTDQHIKPNQTCNHCNKNGTSITLVEAGIEEEEMVESHFCNPSCLKKYYKKVLSGPRMTCTHCDQPTPLHSMKVLFPIVENESLALCLFCSQKCLIQFAKEWEPSNVVRLDDNNIDEVCVNCSGDIRLGQGINLVDSVFSFVWVCSKDCLLDLVENKQFSN